MPLYEFQCPHGHVSEDVRPVAEYDLPLKCSCGEMAFRIMSATPTTFKFADSSGRKRIRTNPQNLVRGEVNFRSPIDGTPITSQRALNEHMRKHDVVPFEPPSKKAPSVSAFEKQERARTVAGAFEHERNKLRYNRN